MKYTKLGNSDLHVSRICLGCMALSALCLMPLCVMGFIGIQSVAPK